MDTGTGWVMFTAGAVRNADSKSTHHRAVTDTVLQVTWIHTHENDCFAGFDASTSKRREAWRGLVQILAMMRWLDRKSFFLSAVPPNPSLGTTISA